MAPWSHKDRSQSAANRPRLPRLVSAPASARLRPVSRPVATATACPENFFGILGTAHARQYRIASGRETRVQATEGLQQEGANQESRSISTDVPRIDPAAGKILGSRSK